MGALHHGGNGPLHPQDGMGAQRLAQRHHGVWLQPWRKPRGEPLSPFPRYLHRDAGPQRHLHRGVRLWQLHGRDPGHPYIAKYNRNQGIICCGLGAWEMPETSRRLRHLFMEKGINIWVDFWGYDVNHDWPWWHKQVAYFVPKLLEH